jgi:hypothetical protein
MKKFILSIFIVAATVAAVATGIIPNNPNQYTPPNPSQTGTLYPQATNGTAAAGYLITNSFPVPYTAAPVVLLYPSSGSVTNISVSPTNFVVASSTTNVSVGWVSYPPYYRVQSGLLPAGVTNFTFAYPFTATPVVQLEAVNTNNYSLGTVTATNFTVNEAITNGTAVYWGAFGTAYAPGPNIVTY